MKQLQKIKERELDLEDVGDMETLVKSDEKKGELYVHVW